MTTCWAGRTTRLWPHSEPTLLSARLRGTWGRAAAAQATPQRLSGTLGRWTHVAIGSSRDRHRLPASHGFPARLVWLVKNVGVGIGLAGLAGLGAGWYALRATLVTPADPGEGGVQWAAFSTLAYLQSLPRTLRAAAWGISSAIQYKSFEAHCKVLQRNLLPSACHSTSACTRCPSENRSFKLRAGHLLFMHVEDFCRTDPP